jgi:hypothetical protein
MTEEEVTDEQLRRAEVRVRTLAEELTRAIDRHIEKYSAAEGEDSVVADMKCAVVVVLGRVAETTSWDKFEVLNEVAEILGLRVKVVSLRSPKVGQA